MEQLLKVEGHVGLVRDTSNMAIINTNKSEYLDYLERKRSADNKMSEILFQSVELRSLRKDVDDIKSLITKLIEKIDK